MTLARQLGSARTIDGDLEGCADFAHPQVAESAKTLDEYRD